MTEHEEKTVYERCIGCDKLRLGGKQAYCVLHSTYLLMKDSTYTWLKLLTKCVINCPVTPQELVRVWPRIYQFCDRNGMYMSSYVGELTKLLQAGIGIDDAVTAIEMPYKKGNIALKRTELGRRIRKAFISERGK